jgi:hypothetical protein
VHRHLLRIDVAEILLHDGLHFHQHLGEAVAAMIGGPDLGKKVTSVDQVSWMSKPVRTDTRHGRRNGPAR